MVRLLIALFSGANICRVFKKRRGISVARARQKYGRFPGPITLHFHPAPGFISRVPDSQKRPCIHSADTAGFSQNKGQ